MKGLVSKCRAGCQGWPSQQLIGLVMNRIFFLKPRACRDFMPKALFSLARPSSEPAASAAVSLKASAFTGKAEFYETLYFLDDVLIGIRDSPSVLLSESKSIEFNWLNRERMQTKLGFQMSLLEYRQIRQRLSKIASSPISPMSSNIQELLGVFGAPMIRLSSSSLENETDLPSSSASGSSPYKSWGRVDALGRIVAVGKRKSSMAKVMMVRGKGDFFVNGKPLVDYFPRSRDVYKIASPLKALQQFNSFNVWALTKSGGHTGQSGAVTLALARALAIYDPKWKETLDAAGLLRRDPRQVERKKPGQEKARKKFTWVKRMFDSCQGDFNSTPFQMHWRRWFSQFQLRDYQMECIKTSLEQFKVFGVKRQAVSLPVGSGKTVIFSNLISQVPDPEPERSKVLVLAHREELLLQAIDKIRQFNPGKRIDLEKGEIWADVDLADIIVASVPTLGRRNDGGEGDLGDLKSSNRLLRFPPEKFKCIIIDEAHHSAAPSYKRILDHFGALSANSEILVWGCSATLRRHDHLSLGNLFEKIVYHLDITQLISFNWLCRPELLQIYTEFQIDEIVPDSKGADFSLDDLSLALNTPKRNDLIAETWLNEASQKHRRKSTIVFAINVEHVFGLAHSFKKICGFAPKTITGKTDSYERAQILSDFSHGHQSVIINCGVLVEGTDMPRTDCILLARPTCNSSLYIQMIGRGLRRHSDKSYCLILDVIDKLKSPRRSLITFPSLLSNTSFPSQKCSDPEAPPDRTRRTIEEINFDAVSVQVDRNSCFELNLEGEALAWVKIPTYPIHVLECPEFRVIVMEEAASQTKNETLSDDSQMLERRTQNSAPKYTAIVTSKRKEDEDDFKGFERLHAHAFRQSLGQRTEISEILLKVNDFIARFEQNTHVPIRASLLKSAYWRRTFPPTRKQIAILSQALKHTPSPTNMDPPLSALYRLSKGQAATAMTRINFLKTLNKSFLKASNLKWEELIN